MALTLPKLALPKLALPKLASNKKQIPAIVGGVIVIAAAGWFGWQYFAQEPPAPARKPQAVKAAKRPPPAKAPTPAEISQARDKLIGEVLAATGLEQQLSQLPQRLASGVRQSDKRKARPAVAKAIEDAMSEAFTAKRFQDQVNAELKKDFDQQRLQALLKDFSTPTAKTMVELERASPSPEAFAEFARSASAARPSPERASLIKRIDAATRASDLAVEAAFVSMKALAVGIAGENARKAAAIDSKIEKQRASTTRTIRDATLLNLAFSFKDASDADLAKYAAIYETQDSKWLYGLVYATLLKELEGASVDAGKRIIELPIAPQARAMRRAGAKAGKDARVCLDQPDNAAIIKCAEAYR